MLSFKDVLKKTLESGGMELLGNSSRFQSFMLDMAEGKLPYIQQYLQVCTQDYLRYFYEASKCDTIQDILRFGKQAGEYLRSSSFINEEKREEITGAFVEVICELKHIPYQGSSKEEERKREDERRAAEEKRREEERRQAEEKRREDERRAAEEKRREEERRQAEEKKREDERKAAEEKKREEERKNEEERRRKEKEGKAQPEQKVKKKSSMGEFLLILLVLGAVAGIYYYNHYVKSPGTTASTSYTYVPEVDEHLSEKEEKSLSFCKDIYNQYTSGWDQLLVNYETDSFEDIAAVLQSRGWLFFPDDNIYLNTPSDDILAFDGILEGCRLLNAGYRLSESSSKYCRLRLIEQKDRGERSLEITGGGDLGGVVILYDLSSDETKESQDQAVLTSLKEKQRQGLEGFVPPAVVDMLDILSIREIGLTAKKEKRLLNIIEKHSKYNSVYLDDREWKIYASVTEYESSDQPSVSYFSISHQSKDITFSQYSDKLIHNFTIDL